MFALIFPFLLLIFFLSYMFISIFTYDVFCVHMCACLCVCVCVCIWMYDVGVCVNVCMHIAFVLIKVFLF